MRSAFRRPRVATVTMAAVPVLLVAVGCKATNTINTKSAEDAIAVKMQQLNPESGPFTVTCPVEIVAKQGNTFTCSVKGGDGTTFNVIGTQTDDTGTFDIKPETDLKTATTGTGG